MNVEKRIVIIAGPNGAGKTTFAREYLPNEAGCPIFVNADLIAAGLSPFSPDTAALRAGKLMIHEMDEYVRRSDSFAFETTLSGKRYERLIPQWQTGNYHVKLVFLYLANTQIAIDRVASRVQHGGHNVAEPVIRRRFEAGWKNFNTIYKQIVNTWILYDNSGDIPELLDMGGGS